MAQVELKVVVDKSQLDQLQKGIADLQKTIDIKVTSQKGSGLKEVQTELGKVADNTQRATQATQEYGRAMAVLKNEGFKFVNSERDINKQTGQVIRHINTFADGMGNVKKAFFELNKETGKLDFTKIKQSFSAEAFAPYFDSISKNSRVMTANFGDLVNSLHGIGRGFKSAKESAEAFAPYLGKIGDFTGSIASKEVLGDVSQMKSYINSIEGLETATVRAAKNVTIAGREFQKFTTEIDTGNGTIAKGEVYVDKLTGETYKLSKGFDEAKIKADELYNNIKKFARWYIIGTFFSKIAGSLRDALKEMKAVDTELITVRKVTDMTAGELQKLTDTAYETAEALGATASAFLNAVSTFSKAGYDAQAESLAELAIKAANVGDTTQETANQFLLAVDKAYQYQGSIESLTRVLDGANEIGNQYATDVEHIASGLGLVAPVAAQAHISIEELTAAIGTITAVTQRSGTEAARALRALILNIMKDTTTEVEDGVALTADEINGLHDLLNMYASDVVKAAEATGKVINPMEAMAALAKSMQDGILTEQKMTGMATELGGKLRTTQLVALIQNWDMYNDMLETYRTSLGSADREYQIYLDSWEAKLNQLSASWTSFVNDIISTDAIKTALDGIIALVNMLDNSIVTTVISATALSAAIIGLGKAFKFLGTTKIISELGTAIGTIFKEDKFMTDSARVKGGLKGVADAIGKANLAIIGFTVAFTVLSKAYDVWSHQLENQIAKVEDLKKQYQELNDAEGEYAELKKKAANGELDARGETRLILLQAQNEELRKQIEYEEEREYKIFKNRFGMGDGARGTFVGGSASQVDQFTLKYKSLIQMYEGGKIAEEEYYEGLLNLANGYGETANSIKEYAEQGRELTPEMEVMVEQFDDIIDRIKKVNPEIKDLTDGIDDVTNSILTIEGLLGTLQEPYELLKQAQSDMNDIGIVSANTVKNIADKHKGLMKYLVQTKDGYVLTNNALQDYIQSQRAEYEIALNDAKSAAIELINSESKKQIAYNATTEEIKAQLKARMELARADLADLRAGNFGNFLSSGRVKSAIEAYKAYEEITKQEQRLATYEATISTLEKESGKGGKSGGGSSSSDKDTYLAYLQSIVKLRESELDLLDAQGANIGTQVGKIKEIQDALHKEAEYLRSTNNYLKGDADTLADINALSKQWLEYQEKIAALQKELQDELNDYVDNEFKKAKEAKEAQIKLLDEEIERRKQAKDDAEKTNELEEKINAVLEKRKALQNALNERNVRYYNAKTGQWEWGYNAKNVADAKKDLEEAEEELAKYRKDLKYEAAIADLENKKKLINDTYDLLEDSWTKVTDSLQKPTRKINDILSDIAKNGTPEMKRQVEAVSKLLAQLGIYISDVTSGQIPNLENIENVGGNLQIGQTTTSASGGSYTQMNYRGSVTTQKGIDLYNQLASGAVSQVVDGNGNTWEYAGNNTVRVYTPSGNTYLADVKGATTSSSSGGGSGSRSGSSSGGGGGSSSGGSSSGSGSFDNSIAAIYEREKAKGNEWDTSVLRDMQKANERAGGQVYDSGGVLYGLGGIKATRDNEIILPPSITKQMLKPSANKDFQKRLSELNYMYGASQTVPPTLISNTHDSIGKQYNGDIYQYGNITLTREEAKNTSVYDLARLSNKLCIYSKVN